jgi:hypothetical protein
MLLKKFELIENILFFKKKLWVLEFDQLKLNIIREIHDQSVAEHSDVRRTCKYLNKWYYWSQVKQSVEKYVRNCHICRRFKASRDKLSVHLFYEDDTGPSLLVVSMLLIL